MAPIKCSRREEKDLEEEGRNKSSTSPSFSPRGNKNEEGGSPDATIAPLTSHFVSIPKPSISLEEGRHEWRA